MASGTRVADPPRPDQYPHPDPRHPPAPRRAPAAAGQLDDLRRGIPGPRDRGDVQRPDDGRVRPERVVRGQRFGAEHVEHRAGDVAAVERREQIGFDDVTTACGVHDERRRAAGPRAVAHRRCRASRR